MTDLEKTDLEKIQVLDRIHSLRAKIETNYSAKEHKTGVIEQCYGTGIVPLRHALWLLKDLEEAVIDDRADDNTIAIRLAFILGVMFSFALVSREESRTVL